MDLPRCPSCNVEYVEVDTEFEYGDVVLRYLKATKCPECGRELFTPEQYRAIKERLQGVLPALQSQLLRLKRKISAAGKRPVVYLPEGVVKAVNANVGDEVDIYVEGNKIVIEKAAWSRSARRKVRIISGTIVTKGSSEPISFL